jgi:NitT/TauT family transport system permease protein
MKLKSVVSIIVSLSLWYLLAKIVSLPYPHEVVERFLSLLFLPEPVLGKTLIQHALASLFRVLTASLIAFLMAIPVGILSGWNDKVRDLLIPIIEVLRPIPPLAWIPLAYIIFAPLPNPVQISQLFIVFVGAFFPCIITVFDTARNTPEELVEMARAFGADDWKILKSIVIPHSMQGIMTGVRVGLGVGWMSIIAAEMLATSGAGLGYFILVMYQVGGRAAEIVSGIAMIGFIGYTLNSLLLRLERVIMPWR